MARQLVARHLRCLDEVFMEIQNPNSHSDDSMNENEVNGNTTATAETKIIARCTRKQKSTYIAAAGGAKLETWVIGVLDKETEREFGKRYGSLPYFRCCACGGNVTAINSSRPNKNGNVGVLCELCGGSRGLVRYNPDNHFGA